MYHQMDATNNCALLECPSITASNLYESVRKTKVSCQVGTDKEEPIIFDEELETSPGVDGNCHMAKEGGIVC